MMAGLTIFGGDTLKRNQSIRDKVINLEKVISRDFCADGDVDNIAPVNNYHCEGNYAREILIAAGTCVIGKIHKHEHINVISKGSCWVVTEEGRELLEAPLTFISKPGIKRAVYAVDDVVWTTVHPTTSDDLEEIENEVIAKSYDELDNLLGVIL